jgi:hypothetical protein
MSNKKWVCFGCRVAVRRPQSDKAEVLCSECGKPCSYIGYKIPVPPKGKVREWKLLQEQLHSERSRKEIAITKSQVRRKHELEQEIVRLEAMPKNEGRTKAVKQLRKKLGALNA